MVTEHHRKYTLSGFMYFPTGIKRFERRHFGWMNPAGPSPSLYRGQKPVLWIASKARDPFKSETALGFKQNRIAKEVRNSINKLCSISVLKMVSCFLKITTSKMLIHKY